MTNSNVFRSLFTRFYLVRTPDGRHGAVYSFNKRSNMVTIQLGSSGPFTDIHLLNLRAGNDATEEHVTGRTTKTFPKVL